MSKSIIEDNSYTLLGDWKTYVKKPIPIKAIQMQTDFTVKTLEGTMIGKKGDYLICGVKGELYVCNKEIFEETYELVED
ncbi:MAG: hypothetical protein H0Z24_05590 [Thermosipho sp. (in: Bacteria)]|nr:hypothetical protein [Thermosipho sp. (in: thermotogales)]